MQCANSSLDLEHVLSLVVEDASPELQVLAPKELRDRDALGLWWAGRDRDLLAGLRSLLLLLTHLLLLHSLGFDALDVFGNCHASFLGLGGDLCLHGADLLWRGLLAGLDSSSLCLCLSLSLAFNELRDCEASFLCFSSHLCLHGADLLRRRLLAGLHSSGLGLCLSLPLAFNELRNRQTGFLCLSSNLCLHGADLFWRGLLLALLRQSSGVLRS